MLDQPGGPASKADADAGRSGRISGAGGSTGGILADTRAGRHRDTATSDLALAGAEIAQLRATASL